MPVAPAGASGAAGAPKPGLAGGVPAWDRFVATADRMAPIFAERTRSMTALIDSSILFSDGLCVCALCDLFEVDYLLESGTGFGGSTEMFARYFADGSRVRRIWSVDLSVHPMWQRVQGALGLKTYSRHVWSSLRGGARSAKARLAPFPRVTLLHGDACEALPPLAARLAGEGARIGVVIDGPKGAEQLQLAEQLFAISPQVRFAALDDIGPMFDAEGRHDRFRSSRFASFATSDAVFFDRYGWINAGRLPGRMLGRPDHRGYGLGVLVNA